MKNKFLDNKWIVGKVCMGWRKDFQAKINLDAWSKGETVKVQFVM